MKFSPESVTAFIAVLGILSIVAQVSEACVCVYYECLQVFLLEKLKFVC